MTSASRWLFRHAMKEKAYHYCSQICAPKGAEIAKGEFLLFLDADDRLGPGALQRLLQTFVEQDCTLSVQPYHKTEKWHEQASVIFKLIQIAANGTALPNPVNIGLYGPVILISKADYHKIRGHVSVRNQIVENMALGQRFRDAGLGYRLFIGDTEISLRMYSEGIQS